MGIYLSAGLLDRVAEDLIPRYGTGCPVRLVYRASWPEERILESTLARMAADAAAAAAEDGGQSFGGQLMVLVGPVLDPESYDRSRLYDGAFTHGRRRGQGS